MNNSFTNCLNNICGLELATLCNYKYAVYGGNTAVVEGHKGIVEYTLQKVSFVVKGATIVLYGSNLKIKCLDKNFAVVCGEITSIGVTQ